MHTDFHQLILHFAKYSPVYKCADYYTHYCHCAVHTMVLSLFQHRINTISICEWMNISRPICAELYIVVIQCMCLFTAVFTQHLSSTRCGASFTLMPYENQSMNVAQLYTAAAGLIFMGRNPQRRECEILPISFLQQPLPQPPASVVLGPRQFLVIASGNLFLHWKSISKGPNIRQVLALAFVLLSITALSYANRLGIISFIEKYQKPFTFWEKSL